MASSLPKPPAFCQAVPVSSSIATNSMTVGLQRLKKSLSPSRKCRIYSPGHNYIPLTIDAAAHPPRRVGNVAKDLREALQNSLQKRTSRINIRLPFGAKIGTEKRDDKTESIETQRTAGDRELGRIISGMFEGTGLSVCVAFATENERAEAVRMWGPLSKCETTVWSSSSSKQSKSKRKTPKTGFGAKGTGGDNIQKSNDTGDSDVYVTVGGGAAFMQRVKTKAQSVGMDRLIIIANGNSADENLPVDTEEYLNNEFESVYYYQPNPNPKWSGGVLFRKFPDEWVFCRLTGIGLLQELIKSETKPSMEDIEHVLKKEEKKGDNQVLKTINNFIDFTR